MRVRGRQLRLTGTIDGDGDLPAAIPTAASPFASGTRISSRFVELYNQGLEAPSLDLPLAALPREVNLTLSAQLVSWSELSGTLQRLVLWDAGFVVVAHDTRRLARVYVECGLSMDESLVSSLEYESEGCAERQCDNVRMAAGTCPEPALSRLAKCASAGQEQEDVMPEPALHTAIWSEEATNSDIPHPTMFQITNASFAIHMQERGCSAFSESCPRRLRLAIPCVQFDNSSKWCIPKPSGVVPSMLQSLHTSTSLHRSENRALALPLLWVSVMLLAILVGTIFVGLRRRLYDLKHTMDRVVAVDGKPQPTDPTTATITSAHELDEFTSIRTKKWARTKSLASLFYSSSNDSSASHSSYTDLINASEVLIAFQTNPTVLQKRIPMMDIVFSRRLCSGASGDVYLGRVAGRRVAIKQLVRLKQNELDDVENFAREIQLTATLDHPNIIRMLGVAWNTFQNMALVLEYRSGGDLLNAIRKRGARWTWNAEKLGIAIGIARAMVYLHSRAHPLVHRDIKSRNVLVDAVTLEPALCDFGSSRNVSALDLLSTDPAGTILWSAPEVISSQDYSVKADIFSFGVVLAELDTCALPYTDERDSEGRPIMAFRIAHMVVENQVKPQLTELCPRFIRELVMMCVQHKPARRPTAEQVLTKLTEATLHCAALWKSRTNSV